MRKLIIAVVVVAALAGGLYGVSKIRIGSFLDGKRGEVTRGDLIIPVTASGPVEPKQFIAVKSKASGQVQKTHVVAGQLVNKDEVLLQLDPVDEIRNVQSAQANFDRTASALEKMKVARQNAETDLPLQTKLAEGRLMDASARFTDAKYRYDRMKDLFDANNANESEWNGTQAAFFTAEAAKKMAETEVARAKNNEPNMLKLAEQDVAQAAAVHQQAEKQLEEAKQRKKETTVLAPKDGMVFSIAVKEGEMVQSGTTSFTGGTLLMVLADTTSMFVMAQVDEADIGAIREIAPDHAKPGRTRRLDDAEALAYARRVLSVEETEEIIAESDSVQGLKGRPVEITVEAYREETHRGVIEQILPEPQMLSNVVTFNVRIRMVGDDLEKLLGLQADLEFTTEKIENVVLVKNDALHSEGRDCFVWVPQKLGDSGRWGEEKRPVVIGKTDGTFTQIISGLEAGEEVWEKRPRFTDKEKKAQEQGN